jgi:hypothetical protein
LCPDATPDERFGWLFADWLAGVGLVYSALFAVGSVIFGEWTQALALTVLAAACAVFLYRSLSRPTFQ